MAVTYGRALGPRADTPDDGLPHPDLGPQLNAVFWILTTLSLLFLSLRIYCKVYRGRYLWWDDYVLIASWVWLPRPHSLSIRATIITVLTLPHGAYGS